jgi:hypothetical protein
VTGTSDAAGPAVNTIRDDHAAWLSVLDELERALARAAHPAGRSLAPDARAAGGASHAPDERWSPPAGIGPLPADLADRAARLLNAQLDAQTRLQEERGSVARHLSAVRSVDPARPARDSVYLDVLG